MATTKKTTKKAAVKPARKLKPVDRKQIFKDKDRIYKLRDAIYKKYKNRWSNSYGKDQFEKVVNALNTAGTELLNFY